MLGPHPVRVITDDVGGLPKIGSSFSEVPIWTECIFGPPVFRKTRTVF